MGFFSWIFLMLMKYLCMYSSNTLKLGGMILILSISMSLVISLNYLSWLSLMFFMIYIGGLLVLFFYLSSLNYNPIFSLSRLKIISSSLIKINSLMLIYLVMLNYLYINNSFKFLNKNFNSYSNNLFSDEEFKTMVMVGAMLLMVLWLVTKVTFSTRGALRPTFN